jgi:hypothetical protein
MKTQEAWHKKMNKMIFVSRMIDSFVKFGIKYDQNIVEEPHFLQKLDSLFGSHDIYFPNKTFKNLDYKMCKYNPNYVKKERPLVNNNLITTNPLIKETSGLKFYEYKFLNLSHLFKDYIYNDKINESFNSIYTHATKTIVAFQKKSQDDIKKFQPIKDTIEAITISQASIYKSSLLLDDILKYFTVSEDQEISNLIYCKAIIDKALSPDLRKDGKTNRNLKRPENMNEAEYEVLQGYNLRDDGSLINLNDYVHRKKVLSRMFFIINYYKIDGVFMLPSNYIMEPKADSKTVIDVCNRFFNKNRDLRGVVRYFFGYLEELIKTEDITYIWSECLKGIYHGLGMFVFQFPFR